MTSTKSSVLKDVVAYVDVWSSDKRANYSKPFIQQLEEMGARVSKGFNKQVTHVVFSYGHQATWKKAKKRDVQLVSVLWVGRCYDDGVRADESLFPALNDEKNPVMKNRQHRCMLPKHSPERTIENDWRLKKKFEKLVKELPSLEPQVVDTSPIIIDQENGIIYSPALKRSDYMAQRLKDMKEKRENISPTASQVADSCSPTSLKPSLGNTPTFLKFISDDESDEAIVAEPGGSPAKEEERSSDDEDHNLSGRDSTKPWLSPCQDVPKSSLHNAVVKKVKKQRKSRRLSVRKKSSETIKSGDFSQSPVQDTPSKSRILHKERRQSHGKPTRMLPKESENKLKIPVKKPSTDTKSKVSPNAVKSLNRRSSSATVVSAATETSNKSAPAKKTECITPKKARLSFSALVRSFTVPSKCKNVASSSTDGGDDVFEDYFSPSNHKRPVLPSLPVESKIEVPFELDPLPKRRKPRKSGICGSEKKKRKLEESHCGKYLKHESRRSSRSVQGDLEFPLLRPNSPAVDVKQLSQRQNSVAFSSNSETTEDAEKLRPASTSGNPPLEKEDVTESEQQKNSDLTANCHISESGGNECTVAAGFTEITSDAEENQNKQADGSLQKMVNKTKAPRTLVMTSMPSEKQQTVLQVVKALGGFSIIDRVCESTTHVVSGEHRRTLNILLGIARGCWILSFEWILWCLEQRQWIPEEPYELSDQFPSAQICRLQRHLSAGEHQQDLFQDQPPIFVSQRSQPPTQSLVELIELCGGTACKTVRQAGICVGKYSGRRPEGSRILSEQWILDSITNLKILPYDNYDLE
ncbi:microcephalin isoform X2 [Poecilia reticulata]|uniref:Microcephalin 1 n=2 Tax=Poecilia reticulata TaxID=8081 RepID=A0A3P9QEE2_POERE|nr:PREDICTED: microcephalin isoform X2 [Poecilia reticulata]